MAVVDHDGSSLLHRGSRGSIIFGLVLATLAAGFKGMLAVIGEIALVGQFPALTIASPVLEYRTK
ncbi:hypothetical protein Brsp07_05404 [Brucella sp. NBRC 14130]